MHVTLTETERDVVLEASHPSRPDREALLITAVERIIAVRLGEAESEGWASYAAEQERHAQTTAARDAHFAARNMLASKVDLLEERLTEALELAATIDEARARLVEIERCQTYLTREQMAGLPDA